MSKKQLIYPDRIKLKKCRIQSGLQQQQIPYKAEKYALKFKLRTLQKAEKGVKIGIDSLKSIASFYDIILREKIDHNITYEYLVKERKGRINNKRLKKFKNFNNDYKIESIDLIKIKSLFHVKQIIGIGEKKYIEYAFAPVNEEINLLQENKEIIKNYFSKDKFFFVNDDSDNINLRETIKLSKNIDKLNDMNISLYAGNFKLPCVVTTKSNPDDYDYSLQKKIQSIDIGILCFSKNNEPALKFNYKNEFHSERLIELLKILDVDKNENKFDEPEIDEPDFVEEVFWERLNEAGYYEGLKTSNIYFDIGDALEVDRLQKLHTKFNHQKIIKKNMAHDI